MKSPSLAEFVFREKVQYLGELSPFAPTWTTFWSWIRIPLFILMLTLIGTMTSQGTDTEVTTGGQVISISPDGNFLIRREKAEPGEHGEARKNLLICSKLGKVLYSWTSGLGVTGMLWSPDSGYLAVNDMPGEHGDLVRLFSTDFTKSAVTSLREPDGKQLLREEETRHGSFLSEVDEVHLRAVEWRDGRLWCLFTGSAHPKRQPMVHVPFHRLWVFGVKGVDAPILQEEWTRDLPGERAERRQ